MEDNHQVSMNMPERTELLMLHASNTLLTITPTTKDAMPSTNAETAHGHPLQLDKKTSTTVGLLITRNTTLEISTVSVEPPT